MLCFVMKLLFGYALGERSTCFFFARRCLTAQDLR